MLLGLLIAVERRSRLRLIEPSLLHSRQTVGANVLSLMSTAVMCNVFFFIAPTCSWCSATGSCGPAPRCCR